MQVLTVGEPPGVPLWRRLRDEAHRASGELSPEGGGAGGACMKFRVWDSTGTQQLLADFRSIDYTKIVTL
ncbi:MAG: hypothetical protein KME26_22410 [Oscillatoria princeps RMCB-10]|nr:hypothetical protein [Oscillatoria princeps RMCB-10]